MYIGRKFSHFLFPILNSLIIDSKIGPGVSIGENTRVESSEISHSLIQNNSLIQNAKLVKSMIGNNVHLNHNYKSVSLGDYSQLK